MWVYAKTGYYSVVHKPPCKKTELLIRTRCRDDIENLQKLLVDKFKFSGDIIETSKADYAYRMIVPREIWASFIADLAMELDYANFKNTVPVGDHSRHEAYFRCWDAMYEWQRDLKKSDK